MTEKFNFIILPPEGFHQTFRDRISVARRYIPDVIEVIEQLRKPEDSLVIKYRDENQQKLFPSKSRAIFGYGNILNFCSGDTVVVGPPGSATLECLLNDVNFYIFWDPIRYKKNLFTNQDAVSRMCDLLQIAKSKRELYSNIRRAEVYQRGRSKSDLVHPLGIRLHEIVSKLLLPGD